MTKNTIRKLSSIVNERDVEIEALKQKNDSLLSILQTANGAQGAGKCHTFTFVADAKHCLVANACDIFKLILKLVAYHNWL